MKILGGNNFLVYISWSFIESTYKSLYISCVYWHKLNRSPQRKSTKWPSLISRLNKVIKQVWVTFVGNNGFKPTYLLSWDENIHAILCSILRSDFCVPNYTTQCCKTEKGRSFAIWKDSVLITPMNKIFYYFYTEYIYKR